MLTMEISRKARRYSSGSGVLILIFFALSSVASSQSKFSVTAGWGYYELVNIGAQWNITQISSLSVYAGANMGTKEKQLWSAGMSFDQTFLKPIRMETEARLFIGYALLDQ